MADRLIYELLFSLTASPEICQTSKSKRLEPFDNAVVGRENMTPPVYVPTVCDMTKKILTFLFTILKGREVNNLTDR